MNGAHSFQFEEFDMLKFPPWRVDAEGHRRGLSGQTTRA